jgi:hypothetical protein
MNVMPVVAGSPLMGIFASALMLLARYLAKRQAALADPEPSRSSGT